VIIRRLPRERRDCSAPIQTNSLPFPWYVRQHSILLTFSRSQGQCLVPAMSLLHSDAALDIAALPNRSREGHSRYDFLSAAASSPRTRTVGKEIDSHHGPEVIMKMPEIMKIGEALERHEEALRGGRRCSVARIQRTAG
jgi:hypothetical protein